MIEVVGLRACASEVRVEQAISSEDVVDGDTSDRTESEELGVVELDILAVSWADVPGDGGRGGRLPFAPKGAERAKTAFGGFCQYFTPFAVGWSTHLP